MAYKVPTKEKLYYSIGEVAEMFKVAPSLIRFWEKEFNELKPRKNSKGNRQYTQKDIERLRLIYHLVKEQQMTIAGAKSKLHSGKTQAEIHLEVADSLREIRQLLVKVKEAIQ